MERSAGMGHYCQRFAKIRCTRLYKIATRLQKPADACVRETSADTRNSTFPEQNDDDDDSRVTIIEVTNKFHCQAVINCYSGLLL